MGGEETQPSGWRDDRSVVVLAWLLAIVAGGAVLGLVYKLGALLFVMIDRVDPGDPEAIRGIGWVFGALVGGVVAAGFGVWRAVIAARAARAAEAQVARQQDRDYADLFTKAVEQLGATREVRKWDEDAGREVYRLEPNIEVRLGAIYALERISQDSERDHIAVMETLCAYVRENAPAKGCKNWNNKFIQRIYSSFNSMPKIKVDIQAIVDVIGRRSEDRIMFESNLNKKFAFRCNLTRCNLRLMSFRGGNFSNIFFTGSRLEGTDFRRSTIDNTILNFTYLDYAALQNMQSKNTHFYKSSLQNSLFGNSKLYNTNFEESHALYTEICSCNFSDTKGLSRTFIDGCFGSSATQLPLYAEQWRPIHWHPTNLKDKIERWEAYETWRTARKADERPPWVAEAGWTGW